MKGAIPADRRHANGPALTYVFFRPAPGSRRSLASPLIGSGLPASGETIPR